MGGEDAGAGVDVGAVRAVLDVDQADAVGQHVGAPRLQTDAVDAPCGHHDEQRDGAPGQVGPVDPPQEDVVDRADEDDEGNDEDDEGDDEDEEDVETWQVSEAIPFP